MMIFHMRSVLLFACIACYCSRASSSFYGPLDRGRYPLFGMTFKGPASRDLILAARADNENNMERQSYEANDPDENQQSQSPNRLMDIAMLIEQLRERRLKPRPSPPTTTTTTTTPAPYYDDLLGRDIRKFNEIAKLRKRLPNSWEDKSTGGTNLPQLQSAGQVMQKKLGYIPLSVLKKYLGLDHTTQSSRTYYLNEDHSSNNAFARPNKEIPPRTSNLSGRSTSSPETGAKRNDKFHNPWNNLRGMWGKRSLKAQYDDDRFNEYAVQVNNARDFLRTNPELKDAVDQSDDARTIQPTLNSDNIEALARAIIMMAENGDQLSQKSLAKAALDNDSNESSRLIQAM